MSKQEIYNSSTMGPIPLSFTGRHLLQSLREEIQMLVSDSVDAAKRGCVPKLNAWEPVSRARGRLAKYMSGLEKKQNAPVLSAVSDKDLLDEVRRRGLPSASYVQIYGCSQPPALNEYLVTYVNHEPKARLEGTVHVAAFTMEEALQQAVVRCRGQGYDLKRTDFDVRLVSVPEASSPRVKFVDAQDC